VAEHALRLRGPGGRPLRVGHLTTVDMSLELLLGTELRVDLDAGLEVYGLSAPGDHVPMLEGWGVRHVALPALTRSWRPSSDAAAVRELVAALRGLHLDVLHSHTPKAGVLGRVLGRALRIPVVVNTCHGLWLRDGDPWPRRAAVVGVEAMAGALSHAELYQNDEDRRRLAWAVPAARSEVVGNGIDLTRFGPDPGARRRVRAELGVPADRVLVGAVGRRVAEKGLPELASAARDLADRADFVWVGGPDAAAPLPDQATRGLRLLGERRDLAALYNAFDVFVLPSHREGFSRSAMEAAATGLPLVLTDIRGCREIGRHDSELRLVPAGDVAALTAAIGSLLADPAARHRLGAAARQRAVRTFDQRRVAAASLRTYADVAARRGLGWVVTRPAAVS
jgi:glycosyltransferase involved in cell wall biosynthesis